MVFTGGLAAMLAIGEQLKVRMNVRVRVRRMTASARYR